MQTLLIRLVTCLLALVGVASNANAGATIDLVWADSGTSDTSIAISGSAVLRVILTNDALNMGASVSVDYSDVAGQYAQFSFSGSLGVEPLPFELAPPTSNGSSILNISAAAFIPYLGTGLAAGQSYLLGTIRFHRFGPGGNRVVSAFLGPDDSIAAGVGGDGVLPESQVTLGTATLLGEELIPAASDSGRLLLLAAIIGMAGFGLNHYSRSAKSADTSSIPERTS